MKWLKEKSVIPGFGMTMGFTILYISLVILLPLSTIAWKTSELSWGRFWETVWNVRVLASFKISFGTALLAAAVNALFGFIVAWVLSRYSFPGKKIIDAVIDLPFALPTAVAGIALTSIYAPNGWIGSILAPLGIKTAYSPLGISIALLFIGLPFVIRTLQPVMAELQADLEEAAATLGAKCSLTFRRVIFPQLWPALITGFSLAFARGVGEYGSVVFISGNMPMKTEITPLLIMTKLEQYDYPGATAIALVMLAVSFVMLLLINLLQWRSQSRYRS